MGTSHAGRFARIRRDHETEIAEDYAETISELIDEDGDARIKELAERLGVAHPTVSKTLRRLGKEGIVEVRPYQSVLLTREGKALAQRCRTRHQDVVKFLCAIGVDEATAEADAEGIEHHVSPKTLRVMREFVSRARP